MKTITYCGPFDAVEADIYTFAKGKPLSVPDRLADSLLAQDFQIVPPANEKGNK